MQTISFQNPRCNRDRANSFMICKRISRIATMGLVVLSLGLGNWASKSLKAAEVADTGSVSSGVETYRQLALFSEIFEKISSDAFRPIKDDELVEVAVNGMLTSLDPHSEFWNAKSFAAQSTLQRGEFGGLGIEIEMVDGLVRVKNPIPDTPASKAGIKPGDLITKLDETAVLGLTLEEAVQKMRGTVNTKIKLTIQREKQPLFELVLSRAIIKTPAVKGELIDDIAYLRISTFLNQNTEDDMASIFKKLKAQANGKLKGIIIDLRNNGGGLLDEAVQVSDDFLERGEIVSTRARSPNEIKRYTARSGDISGGLPIAILINGYTASASEIVAGALQDHRRAILIGTKTFGKGSVQAILPVGNHGAMKFTTARYYTPSGRSIQAVGIDPDIIVPQAKIEAVDETITIHESDMRGALKNPNQPLGDTKGDTKKGSEGGTTNKSETKSKPDAAPQVGKDGVKDGGTAKESLISPLDYQLARAIDILHGIIYFANTAANPK